MARALCHFFESYNILPATSSTSTGSTKTHLCWQEQGKKSPCAQGGWKKNQEKSIFHLILFLSKRMREGNGIVNRWVSNGIMCSLKELKRFILTGPIKLATLHDPLLPECWLCTCLSSMCKWNKNKHVCNNFQSQVSQIRRHKFICIW